MSKIFQDVIARDEPRVKCGQDLLGILDTFGVRERMRTHLGGVYLAICALNALLIDNEIALSRSHIIPLDDATFFDLAAKNGGQAKRKDKC